MCSIATTKNKLKIQALNQISMLNELVKEIEDEQNDLVDLSFSIERISREEGMLSEILNDCVDY